MKVFLIILAIFFIVILILLAGAWSMFGEKLTAANSVKKLEEPLPFFLEKQLR